MDKILNFLTKSFIDEAAVIIDREGFPKNREGSKYAVAINNRQYPFKLLVTEAAKIAGENVTHNDFGSSRENRKGFEELTGYSITSINADIEYHNFKKLLEYFVSHLEWVKNNDASFEGYDIYIKSHIDSGSFKMTGQGWSGDGIQKQIEKWESYDNDRICITVQANFGSYTSVKCYLNWQHTGINILAKWNNGKIVGLYQDEFIHWENPTKRINTGKEFTLQELQLFNGDIITTELEDFFKTFKQRHELLKRNQKKQNQMENANKSKSILTYKKQIILQGPPGTGKTREAKLIAHSLLGLHDKLDIEYFKNALVPIKEFEATNNNKSIFIDFINDDVIYFKKNSNTDKYSFSIKDLYDCYTSGDYKNQDYVQYPKYSKRCLVLTILRNYKASVLQEQFKLIQFHPSYTYEDFVRGIIAESKGEKIEYKNVNKTIGLFAEEALRNYKASISSPSEYNVEHWVDSKFEEFKNSIEAKLPEEQVTLSEDIKIYEVTDSHFKYAQSWQTPGYLKFSEFKSLIKAIVSGELELTNKQLDKEKFLHAHYRYTYYNALLKIFFDEYKYDGESYSEPLKNYVLVIDEINRANLSSVLGELIYALEYRGEAVESMYAIDGNNKLILPPNLYIIGTMNTADRSVGHIDYAIRRRFAFVDVPAENLKVTQGLETFDSDLFDAVTALFDTDLSPEFEKKDVQLGHSYFIDKSGQKDGATMAIRLEYEIKPILREYVRDGVLTGENIKEKIEALIVSI